MAFRFRPLCRLLRDEGPAGECAVACKLVHIFRNKCIHNVVMHCMRRAIILWRGSGSFGWGQRAPGRNKRTQRNLGRCVIATCVCTLRVLRHLHRHWHTVFIYGVGDRAAVSAAGSFLKASSRASRLSLPRFLVSTRRNSFLTALSTLALIATASSCDSVCLISEACLKCLSK